jgi:hypothetical protein
MRVPLNEIAAAGDKGITKAWPLLGENNDFSETPLGDLFVTVKWIFDKATDEKQKAVKKSTFFKGLMKFFSRKSKATEEKVS